MPKSDPNTPSWDAPPNLLVLPDFLTYTVNLIKTLKKDRGDSPVAQWFGLSTFIAVAPGSVPGWGAKIPQALHCGQKKEKKIFFNK